jgi:hypothetical protein
MARMGKAQAESSVEIDFWRRNSGEQTEIRLFVSLAV